jgi:N-acetylmuramoyl-L-alanine amidase
MLIVFLLLFPLCQGTAASDRIKREYRQAQSEFQGLLKDHERQKHKHLWFECLKKFRSVYIAKPAGPMADDALFMMAGVYSKLYEVSSSPQYKQEAIDYYARLLKRFPNTRYRHQTREQLEQLRTDGKTTADQGRSELSQVLAEGGVTKNEPVPYAVALETDKPKPLEALVAEVKGLRFWSNPRYTRVVIDVDTDVPYTYRLLRKDPAIGKPQRLFVDVGKARMGADLTPVVPIGDDLLSDARVAQHAAHTVRIVLDIKSIENFKIFSLKNPFRIVLDVKGIPRKISSKEMFRPDLHVPNAKMPEGALAKQLALGVRRIVVDPGHGGKDPGASGYHKRVVEKNVTLEVAKRLARMIPERLGCEAVLTRDRDRFVSLEERTAIANTKDADIFISIHTNASRNRRTRGIETYFLNLATDSEAIMVAARENATSTKNISDLEAILNDLMKNAKVSESSRLAGCVQKALAGRLKGKYKLIKDNGVKQAPFYVLLGAEMPCILVEVGFITHPTGCSRLNSASYQEYVADAIVRGIENYIKEISPTALIPAPVVQARK